MNFTSHHKVKLMLVNTIGLNSTELVIMAVSMLYIQKRIRKLIFINNTYLFVQTLLFYEENINNI